MVRLGGIGKVAGRVAKTGAKVATKVGKNAKTVGQSMKTGASRAGQKIDDAFGIDPNKVSKTTGKTISKNRQRIGKVGDAMSKIPDAIETVNTVKDTVNQYLPKNNDGGGGNPLLAQPTQTNRPPPQKQAKTGDRRPRVGLSQEYKQQQKDKLLLPKGVPAAAKTVINEQNGSSKNKPSRQAYTSALATVNAYEQAGCAKPSKKPNPVGPQKQVQMQF